MANQSNSRKTDETNNDWPLDRRSFIKTVSIAGIGAALSSGVSCTNKDQSKLGQAKAEVEFPQPKRERILPPPLAEPKRYAIVGIGSRHGMYRNAIEGEYQPYARLVGICDINPGRMELARSKSATKPSITAPKPYAPADFEKMIAEQRVQTVIVTTVDGTHHEYMIRAMNAGCDVITEKPMTTTAEKCQQILDARARTGRNCRVTFNYRYSPPRTQVKEILMSGAIGDILSVDFHWLLNTQHGADYFRRWHRNKVNSGGLMIHKATHHFDLVNWWLGATPASVFATGKREFYTPTMARRLGLQGPHERCHTCPEKDKCTFFMDLAGSENLKALYLDNEHYDGYFRDRCVWSDQIDIEDTMNVLVKYENNVTLAYSLNAMNSWEGYHIAFNGTKGRLEHTVIEDVYVSGTDTVQGAILKDGVTTTIIPLRGAARKIEPWTGRGGHGGGDVLLLDDLFFPEKPQDRYMRDADERAGAASVLVGVAANKCFETGQPVQIRDLVTGLNRPNWTAMPSNNEPVPMPPRRERRRSSTRPSSPQGDRARPQAALDALGAVS
jgi:predicted dehydrogenase